MATAEDGFGLVESVVGFVLVVILFIGVATSLMVSIRHQREVRLHQQAAAIGLEQVEFARSLRWTELELTTTPGAGVPHQDGTTIDGAFFEVPDEDLVIDPGTYPPEDPDPGRVEPSSVETVNNQDFEIFRYVTDVEPDLRRLLVLIRWEASSGIKTHLTGTLVSRVGAG